MKFTAAPCALLLASSILTATPVDPATAAEVDPLMLAGKVYSTTVEPVEISAQVWPNQQELIDLPVGASVPVVDIPVIVSGNTYEVRLQMGDVPGTHRDSSGVEVRVDAFRGDALLDSYGEKLSLDSTGGWERNSLVESQTQRAALLRMGSGQTTTKTPGTLTVTDVGGAALKVSTSLIPANLRSVAPEQPTSLASRDRSATSQAACTRNYWNKTSTTWSRRVKIGDVMPAKKFMTGLIRYKIGTKHSIQVAAKGGSLISGKANLSMSSREKVSPEPWRGDKVAWTDWQFRLYENDCAPTLTEARPEVHEGGYVTTERTRPTYTKCKRYRPMAEWASATGKAWTYQAGFSLWGVSFDAQTGYDQETELVYKFPKRQRWLCGNNAFPTQAQLIAGYATNQG